MISWSILIWTITQPHGQTKLFSQIYGPGGHQGRDVSIVSATIFSPPSWHIGQVGIPILWWIKCPLLEGVGRLGLGEGDMPKG